MASNKYMTVDQLAERWMCSPSYVRTLLRSGQLSAVKIAGWKVRQDEVLRFEKAKEQADTEALRQQRIGYIVIIIVTHGKGGNQCAREQKYLSICTRAERFDAGSCRRATGSGRLRASGPTSKIAADRRTARCSAWHSCTISRTYAISISSRVISLECCRRSVTSRLSAQPCG